MSSADAQPCEDHVLTVFATNNPAVKFFRLVWIDYFGITRMRILARSHLLTLQRSNRSISVSPGALNAPYVAEQGRLPRAGASRIEPDWTSLRICHYAPIHAQVMCYICEDFDDSSYDTDPRFLLKKYAQRAELVHGRKVLVGFETEFFLLDPTQVPPIPIQNGSNCWSAAGLRGKHMKTLEEISLVLEQSSIPVEQFHTENANGFFEIATSPMEPMAAVDALIYTHETIKTIANAHGYQATVYPKPSDVNVFAGMHAHLSITPTHNEHSFLAGILAHLAEICVVGMPNYDSHVRLRELSQTTGEWVSWGTQFRDVPVRKVSPAHWEIRCIDGTANMYAVLAMVIGAGCNGLDRGAELGWKDCQMTPGLMAEEVRLQHGITERLPKSMKQGLALLKCRSKDLQEIVGPRFLEKWIYFKEKEEETCSQMEELERRSCFLAIY